MTRVLLFFIDGIGVGSSDPERNPLATASFPTLALTETSVPRARAGPPLVAHGIDAALGVPGLPQSATGQTAILTGVNAPAAMAPWGGTRAVFGTDPIAFACPLPISLFPEGESTLPPDLPLVKSMLCLDSSSAVRGRRWAPRGGFGGPVPGSSCGSRPC